MLEICKYNTIIYCFELNRAKFALSLNSKTGQKTTKTALAVCSMGNVNRGYARHIRRNCLQWTTAMPLKSIKRKFHAPWYKNSHKNIVSLKLAKKRTRIFSLGRKNTNIRIEKTVLFGNKGLAGLAFAVSVKIESDVIM